MHRSLCTSFDGREKFSDVYLLLCLYRLAQEALQDGIPDDGMYHGAAAYKTHIEKREDGVSAKMKSGPVKASSNIRQITVIDYQPDVCKDYKGSFFRCLSLGSKL
jgi:hypothetical protein